MINIVLTPFLCIWKVNYDFLRTSWLLDSAQEQQTPPSKSDCKKSPPHMTKYVRFVQYLVEYPPDSNVQTLSCMNYNLSQDWEIRFDFFFLHIFFNDEIFR